MGCSGAWWREARPDPVVRWSNCPLPDTQAVAIWRQRRGALDARRSFASWVLRGWSTNLARQVGGDRGGRSLLRRDFRLNGLGPATCARRPCSIHRGSGNLAKMEQVVAALAEAIFREDPLRFALRRESGLAAELGFALGEETLGTGSPGPNSHLITQVATGRVLAEAG